MKKLLLLASSALLIGLPAQAETVYLVVKSRSSHNGGLAMSMHSIPMASIDQCEEQGAFLVTNENFELWDHSKFVCITGK